MTVPFLSPILKRPRIMGIINLTPDSFSGDGILSQSDPVDACLAQATRMLEDGADILDLGGESSRPGSTPVGAEEERARILPALKALMRLHPKAYVAIDTTKASVAEAALGLGARMINDISALRGDGAMARVVAKSGCQIVLMDNRSKAAGLHFDPIVGASFKGGHSIDIVRDVQESLEERCAAALAAGIDANNIILDPGLGFGKTTEQNLSLIRHIGELRALGYPLLLGPSRKAFVGHVLDLGVDDRIEGTSAVVAVSSFLGVDILRVHDVKIMSRVATLAATLGASS